jgi:curved DNA-binding protein CbpA
VVESGGDLAARLRVELVRLQPLDPFQVLALPPDATPDAVRRAFLALTKRFHPARYARESPQTIDVANELFLVIRRAYGQLSDDARRRGWQERLALAARRAPPVPQPMAALKSEPIRAEGTRPPASPRRPSPTMPPRRPTLPPAPVSPNTGRTEEEVRALLEEARTRSQRFEQASRLLDAGKFADARERFLKLASEDPQNRRYRHKLLLAIGLEHRDAGRIDEAVRELERAATLDTVPNQATEALKKIHGERKGLFGKLFGR